VHYVSSSQWFDIFLLVIRLSTSTCEFFNATLLLLPQLLLLPLPPPPSSLPLLLLLLLLQLVFAGKVSEGEEIEWP